MPVIARWTDDTQTIQHIHFSGDWSLDELYAVMQEAREMAATINHPYIVLADLTNSPNLPARILSTGNYAVSNPYPPAMVIVIGSGRFLEVTLDMYHNLYPQALPNLTMCATVGEAYRAARSALADYV